jgi:SAM-dependent methyltransferase
MRVAAGFMAAQHLFAASEIGLFEALAEGPADLARLADRAGLQARTARIAADAMVALGLVTRDAGGAYANAPAAEAFLAGAGPADLRPFLRFWQRLSYPAWRDLPAALRGVAPGMSLDGPEANEIFSAGVEAITAGAAHALAAIPELAEARRLLDLGGGTGSFVLPALAAHPSLEATVVELPAVAAIARERLAGEPRAHVVAADLFAEDLPDGHDTVLLANVVHLFGRERNGDLLRRARRTVADGARLLLVDFWTDPTHTEPGMAALLAGEFLLVTGEGDVYSVEEMRDMLAAAGWALVEHRPLAGPQTLIVAAAA